MNNPKIVYLQRLIKIFVIASLMWLVFVMVDYFNPDSRAGDGELIRIPLPPLVDDRAYFVRFDQRQLVVMRYSSERQLKLFSASSASRPDTPQFLLAYALGTYLGCPLEVLDGQYLKESCSTALYDFAGRPALDNQNFTALMVPVYTFCPDYSCINLRL